MTQEEEVVPPMLHDAIAGIRLDYAPSRLVHEAGIWANSYTDGYNVNKQRLDKAFHLSGRAFTPTY